MKKTLVLICVCLLMTDLARGQEGKKTSAIGFSRLDWVSTAEEVEAIIGEVDEHYAKFRVNTALSFADNNCFRLADLSKLTAISKADFDKNGFTDLLVMGMLGKFPLVLSLMGSAGDKISMHIISRHFLRTCSIAQVINEDGTTLVEFKYFNSYADVRDNEVVKSVKLAFKFGDFIEYKPTPKKYNIEKIEYTMGAGGDPLSSFSMVISSNRKGRYMIQNPDFFFRRYSEYISFTGMIPDTIYDEIAGLLNYSDFPNLNNNYEITATDNATALLKITYDGGKIKTIKDYGMLGTYSLNRTYQIMDFLRKSQVWTPKPIKALIPLPRSIIPQLR